MATKRYYTNHAKTSLATFMPDMARFLINDPTSPNVGPGWTVVQTYSGAAAAPFEVPANPNDLSTLAADNTWRTGTVAVGDYIVLESASGANKFQVAFAYHGGTSMYLIAAPTGGFDPTAHQVDPENVLNWLNPRITTVGWSWPVTTNGKYVMTADEDMAVLHFHNLIVDNMGWGYVGKIDGPYTGDTSPVTIRNTFQEVRANGGQGLGGNNNFYRLSTVDNATTIGCTIIFPFAAFVGDLGSVGAPWMQDGGGTNQFRFYPGVLQGEGETGTFGVLRYVYNTHFNIMGKGTGTASVAGTSKLMAMAYQYDNQGVVCWDWDGVTALP